MSKLIRLTEEYKEQYMKEFEEELSKARMLDGTATIKARPKEFDRYAAIAFEPEAYAKMVNVLMEFDKEVAWHCTAKRYGDPDDEIYIIKDILQLHFQFCQRSKSGTSC